MILALAVERQWLADDIRRGVAMSFSASYNYPETENCSHWTPLHRILARTSALDTSIEALTPQTQTMAWQLDRPVC